MSSMSLSAVLFIWSNICFVVFGNDISDDIDITSYVTLCDNEEECANQEINDDKVYCRGFSACDSSTITASTELSCGML